MLKQTVKTVKGCPDEAEAALQDCFGCPLRQMFRDAATQDKNISLEEYTSSVKSYIINCVDGVVSTKTDGSFPNQRTWMNGEMTALSRGKKLPLVR